MNVDGMSAKNPSWTVFVMVTVPGTIGSVILILFGKYLWANGVAFINKWTRQARGCYEHVFA